MKRKTKEGFWNQILIFLSIALFFAGVALDNKGYYVLIPLFLLMLVVDYFMFKKKHGASERLVSSVLARRFISSVLACIVAAILIFIGTCFRSCTTWEHSNRQQRIEMGLPIY